MLGLWLDSMILKVFSSLNDSMILQDLLWTPVGRHVLTAHARQLIHFLTMLYDKNMAWSRWDAVSGCWKCPAVPTGHCLPLPNPMGAPAPHWVFSRGLLWHGREAGWGTGVLGWAGAALVGLLGRSSEGKGVQGACSPWKVAKLIFWGKNIDTLPVLLTCTQTD